MVIPRAENDPPRFLWAAASFFVPFALNLPWIWQGFEMTDTGYHLTLQWLLVQRGQLAGSELMWLTNLIGGVWQSVVGSWGLIGVRIGWTLLMGCMGLSAFHVLKRYFPAAPVVLGIASTVLAAMHYDLMLIDYDNLPALFLLLAAGPLLAAHERTAGGRATLLSVLGGIPLGLAAMSRFPLVVTLLLPFVPPITRGILQRRWPSRRAWGSACLSTVSALAAMAAALAFLLVQGRLGEYARLIATALFGQAYGAGHAPQSLVRVMILSTGVSSVWGAGIVIIGLALAYAIATAWPQIGGRSGPAIAFGAVFLGVLYVVLYPVVGGTHRYHSVLPGVVISMAALTLLLAALRPAWLTESDVDRLALLAVGLCIALSMAVGSDGGVHKCKNGLWLLFPSAFLCLGELAGRVGERLPALRRPRAGGGGPAGGAPSRWPPWFRSACSAFRSGSTIRIATARTAPS
jgi:hypothetical protein